jgi:FkbH-like protein
MLSFNELKRNLKKDFSGFKKIKLALLADSSSQLLNQALRAYGYEVQVDFEIYESDYNQIDLQVFDSSSELYSFQPDFVFFNTSSEHLLYDFYQCSRDQQIGFSERMRHKMKSYYEAVSARLDSKIIINTYPEINDGIFGNYATKANFSFIYQIRKCNLLLMEYAQQTNNLFVCDIAILQSQSGYKTTHDPKMYVNADLVYTIDFLPLIAKQVTDIIQSIRGIFKKCLILDLDNTLWGGIIGDDGIAGIQIGDLGIGKAFTELQLWAKQLKQRGILLAICSKNTEEIAKEAFEKHPDMLLKLEDIAVFRVNWETKVENIRAIQHILNIGFDSMVFIDDNAFEREMVRSAIPGITVPEMPEDPAEYLPYLRDLNLFEIATVTEEDAQRTKQYQEEAARVILQQHYENEEEFLASLEMQAVVKSFDKFDAPRIAQLSQRSNQFNLRTIRYTEDAIHRISSSADYYTISVTLRDRFGEHGLIGIIILKISDAKTLFIENWIMSCRVLKRGMENFTLNQIIELALSNGYTKIVGEYLPTPKNGIVKDHYAELGFSKEDDKWVISPEPFQQRKNFINIFQYGTAGTIK